MPLPGVTPFPPEFAARYRARGYWDDRPLITNFLKVFADHASRAAVIDDEGSYTYAELATTSERVALNLLDLGVEPADRVVVQLPNTRLFASFYFALERIAGQIDPDDPAVFQLSGGTTGLPKLIPRTHNDYAFNSRAAVSVCDVREGDVLLDVLPIAHNLPLACPGMQGFLLSGATVRLSASSRAQDVFDAIDRHRVTHIHVVPALLIRWINDPGVAGHDLGSVRVIQSGGQRLQPETRVRTERVFRNGTVQENFGMAEGLLMFVRLDDPPEVRLETVGRPICPDDEVRLVTEDGLDVPDGETGELLARGPYTLRGYYNAPEHNQRAFTPDGFYRSGDLMWRHPSGNYVAAGRSKDLINRGGEKISAGAGGNPLPSHPPGPHAARGPGSQPRPGWA